MTEKEEGEVLNEDSKHKESNEKTYYEQQKRVPISKWQCRQADLYEDRIQVGEGTFGKVRLGIHMPTNQKVAVKTLQK